MHRRELDPARLAAALIVTRGGHHSSGTRRVAYRDAQALHAALEDAVITEGSLAMAMHGAWCSETRSGSFHSWSRHRPEAERLLTALDDPALDATLLTRADDSDPDQRAD
jgi:hypothetical protein